MPGTMEPAILVLEFTDACTFTLDGIAVEVVHTEYEGNTEQDDCEVGLVMELEQEVVVQDCVSSKQILQFLSANDLVHVDRSACLLGWNRTSYYVVGGEELTKTFLEWSQPRQLAVQLLPQTKPVSQPPRQYSYFPSSLHIKRGLGFTSFTT